MQCKVVRVKPWGTDQGAFVEINESDFDPKVHELYTEVDPGQDPNDGVDRGAPKTVVEVAGEISGSNSKAKGKKQ